MTEDSRNIFDATSCVEIGNTDYIVERHFNGSRSVAEAVYEAVKNEVVRHKKGEQV